MTSSVATAATLVMLLFCAPTFSLAYTSNRIPSPSPLWRRASNSRSVPPEGFYNPSHAGGDMLTVSRTVQLSSLSLRCAD